MKRSSARNEWLSQLLDIVLEQKVFKFPSMALSRWESLYLFSSVEAVKQILFNMLLSTFSRWLSILEDVVNLKQLKSIFAILWDCLHYGKTTNLYGVSTVSIIILRITYCNSCIRETTGNGGWLVGVYNCTVGWWMRIIYSGLQTDSEPFMSISIGRSPSIWLVAFSKLSLRSKCHSLTCKQ